MSNIVVMDIINAMLNDADWYVNPITADWILHDVLLWKRAMILAIFRGA